MFRKSLPIAATFVLVMALPLFAQKTTQVHPGKGGSPHVRTEWTVDGATISIEYGRPFLKGRTPGKDVDPYPGKWWRTGADEATTLATDADLMFGAVHVPAGKYTLFTIIDQGGAWKLIVNKQTGQWGLSYDEKQDLARVDMKTTKLDKPADQLTISIDKQAGGGVLHVDWAATRASAPFTIMKKKRGPPGFTGFRGFRRFRGSGSGFTGFTGRTV